MIQKICKFVFFQLLGWKVIGKLPEEKRYLFVAAPHTTNWDFIYAWMAVRTMGLEVTIFAKDAYYIWPLRPFCWFFGVAPVNRRESTNFVDAVVRQYEEREELIAMITPEGTRSFRPNLKSGYYYLAVNAQIPLVLAGPNYKEKSFTLMPPRPPMASFEEDEQDVIEFCK